ncbi:replicative DNA helicase [Candidatus Wolfebacteria bacterium]|nr:replicative DNA helicase [Candidatus Wolfebacteria bacterium]
MNSSAKNIKLPPRDLEAEKSILGSFMLDKNAIIKVADLINPEDFYDSKHQKIYSSILELYEKNQPIDVLTVSNKLKNKEQLSDVGGSAYLAELVNFVPSASHVNHYAQIIREKKVLRDLVSTSGDIVDKVFATHEDPEFLLDQIEQKIFSIGQKVRNYLFLFIKDLIPPFLDRLAKAHERKDGISGVTSGFKKLDYLLAGFQKSDLVILGARPSMGKTALVLDMARNAAKEGHAIAIFSLEMSKEQIMDRFVSAEAKVPLWRLRTGRLTDDLDFEMIQAALDKISNMKIFIDDTPSMNILQIRSMARRLQMENALDLIIIDYVQLITPLRHSENVVQQFTEISHGLKALARELNLPVLALSQLNRAVDQRESKKPKLSDLRETGSWEQDADIVMFIYRADRDKENPSIEEINTAKIVIGKHRNGPLGEIDLKFDPEKVSFTEIDTVHNEYATASESQAH